MTFRSAILLIVFAVLAATVLGGCKPLCLTTKTLTIKGTPAAGADVVLQVAQEKRPCVPRKQFGELPFAGTITWRETPWVVDGYTVAGTSDPFSCAIKVEVLRLEPAPQSGLAHEIGHWYWHWCFNSMGETMTPTDTGINKAPNADLVQWFTEVNAEATRRMNTP